MFISPNTTKREKTWDALLQRQVDATTDTDNLDNTVFLDWREFVVVCQEEFKGMEVQECSSYEPNVDRTTCGGLRATVYRRMYV